MKVLHLAHGCRPDMNGGVESYVETLLVEQRRQGLEPVLLAGSHEPRPDTVVEAQEIGGHTVYRLHRDDLYFDLWTKSYHVGAERAIETLMLREKPDVVHVHQWIRLTANLVEIAARHGIPAIVTTHDVYTSCPRAFRIKRDDSNCTDAVSVANCLDCVPKFGHETERELSFGIELFRDQFRAELEGAAKVLVANPATRDLIATTTGIDPATFELLPLPYDRRFDGVPHTPSTGQAPFRFAYWGVMTHRKGAVVMAKAFARMCDNIEPGSAELHLFGKPDTDALDAELREILAGKPAFFHGRYEYEQLAAAELDAAIFPMLCFETWGFVLDECYELGLPCITTENGALANRAGGGAIVVPPGDIGALRGAMRTMLNEPERVARMRAAIPDLPPTPAEHAEALRGIYEAAVTAGPRAAAAIPASRRARLLEMQRESAIGRVVPPEGPK